MTRLAAFALACVRCWTRMYTWRLPPAVRDARREEIESDLWESSHDPDMTQARLVVQLMMRLALGIADDVVWRSTQVTAIRPAIVRTLAAAAVLCMLLFVAMSRLATDLPHLPEPPLAAPRVYYAVPDPPPPPRPPAGTGASEPIFQYGRTSYSVETEGPAPVPVKQVRPIYPPVAVAGGLEGEVLVRGRITEEGRVTDAKVAPAGILGYSALHAVQRWEFAAAGSGNVRPALLTVRVTFGRPQ